MKVLLNGKPTEVEEEMPLSRLIGKLNLSHDQVVVELNLEVVPRERLEATLLHEGDRVELVHFVGGG